MSKIDNDEGVEIKVLGFRRYPQANGYTDSWITLEDRRDVQLYDLDRGRKFAGFADARLYTAKLVNDDFVFREVREVTDSSK